MTIPDNDRNFIIREMLFAYFIRDSRVKQCIDALMANSASTGAEPNQDINKNVKALFDATYTKEIGVSCDQQKQNADHHIRDAANILLSKFQQRHGNAGVPPQIAELSELASQYIKEHITAFSEAGVKLRQFLQPFTYNNRPNNDPDLKNLSGIIGALTNPDDELYDLAASCGREIDQLAVMQIANESMLEYYQVFASANAAIHIGGMNELLYDNQGEKIITQTKIALSLHTEPYKIAMANLLHEYQNHIAANCIDTTASHLPAGIDPVTLHKVIIGKVKKELGKFNGFVDDLARQGIIDLLDKVPLEENHEKIIEYLEWHANQNANQNATPPRRN